MGKIVERYKEVEEKILGWMARHGIFILRICMGIVFFWFGFLKFFPGLSPAQGLAVQTIEKMTFGIIPPEVSIILLAVWECLIGLGFLSGKFLRATLFLLFTQMIATTTPLFFFPQLAFTAVPYAPTLEGQYIIKNLVLISGGMVIGGTLHGKKETSES